MSTFFSVLIVLGLIGLVALFWRLQAKLNVAPPSAVDPQALLLIQQQMEAINRSLSGSLSETARQQLASNHQMTNTVRDVTERLVKIEEINKQILSFSGQLGELQRILTNPKQRGILGEYYLETLLKNIFAPDQYEMQYKFKDGEIVDAAVFVQTRIVPVDSKFSLENYNRLVEETQPEERARLEKLFLNDLKNRILETKKYIRPEEGTMDFAFMFIPHEAIYYDLLLNRIGSQQDGENLLQRAASAHHVIIVSPTSFSAYLQTVLQGLNALKIEEQAKEIRLRVQDLGRHLAAYQQCFENVGKHLGTTVNQYNLASREYAKIDKDVLRITGQQNGFQSALIEKPHDDAT